MSIKTLRAVIIMVAAVFSLCVDAGTTLTMTTSETAITRGGIAAKDASAAVGYNSTVNNIPDIANVEQRVSGKNAVTHNHRTVEDEAKNKVTPIEQDDTSNKVDAKKNTFDNKGNAKKLTRNTRGMGKKTQSAG